MNARRPEPGAMLDHICIRSPEPSRLAEFFQSRYGMEVKKEGEQWLCEAPGRTLIIALGQANSVGFFAFAFSGQDQLAAYREALTRRGAVVSRNPSPLFDNGALSLTDPDGNSVAFGYRQVGSASKVVARLQHIAFRTTQISEMLDFYTKVAGLVVSDLVKDDEGKLRACFLRADAEHHTLALFAAPVSRLDHHSYETTHIDALTAWADRVSSAGTPIYWGIGRHGPGNDVFFMVKDPDDNLVEISTELEQCAADRPAGLWRHEQRTLNLWGTAIMRS